MRRDKQLGFGLWDWSRRPTDQRFRSPTHGCLFGFSQLCTPSGNKNVCGNNARQMRWTTDDDVGKQKMRKCEWLVVGDSLQGKRTRMDYGGNQWGCTLIFEHTWAILNPRTKKSEGNLSTYVPYFFYCSNRMWHSQYLPPCIAYASSLSKPRQQKRLRCNCISHLRSTRSRESYRWICTYICTPYSVCVLRLTHLLVRTYSDPSNAWQSTDNTKVTQRHSAHQTMPPIHTLCGLGKG